MKPLLVIVMAGLLSACGSSPPVRFFTLDAVQPSHPSADGSARSIQIVAVHIPAVLDRRQMVREGAPNMLTISDRNRWGAPLSEMTRDVLTQDLMQRLPKRTVVLPDSTTPADTFLVAVDILRFGSEAPARVVLEGSWSLSPTESATPIAVRQFLLHERVEQNEPSAQALAMSKLLGHLADEMADALTASQRDHSP